jgi:Cdc6-like AAA superfamily ATPase
MPIKGLNEIQLAEILGAHLTPSKEILTPERLLGREQCLKQINRAFSSDGRNVFVYGDRGIGKTSVARTAATINNFAETSHIYVACGEDTSFGQIIQAIGNDVIPVAKRLRPKKVAGGGTVGVLGTSLGANFSTDTKSSIDKPTSVIEALDILTFVAQSRMGRTIAVVDEFDRISSDLDKVLFAELIKNLSTRDIDLRFIFCGIGHTVDELLGKHLSVGRYFQPIGLEKLHHDHLWGIINTVADKTGVTIPQEILYRIGIVSDGFPHFVHLIGQCMFYAMHDSPEVVTVCSRDHYDAGIKHAIDQTEPPLRAAYLKATEKTKNKLEYEEALWALADRAETRRQVSKIYELSYKRLIQHRSLASRSMLTKDKFNQRLLALRTPGHGSIVIGGGSGWFAFRENVMRGYVRLKAESEGVELTPDLP